MALQNFFLNENVLFESNMFGFIPHHYPLQNISRGPINGMGMFYVVQQDWSFDYQVLT